MAVVIEKPFKEGYLWLPPQGVIGQLKKSWQKKYCQLYKASNQGVDRLEVYESEEDTSKTLTNFIITLEQCIKITLDPQRSQPHQFVVVTKPNTYHFAGSSQEDTAQWMQAFQAVAFQTDAVSKLTIEELNDLYSSSDDGLFTVVLRSTPASERCGLEAGQEYTLVMTPVRLELHDDDSTLLNWPYRSIRSYGCSDGVFKFEAGRQCSSGEGSFLFDHPKVQDIYKCIQAKIRWLKNKDPKDTASIDSSSSVQKSSRKPPVRGESILGGQLALALDMKPGSRSPLPPSPTSATSQHFSSLRQHSTSTTEFTSFSNKPKPIKPPRKQPLAEPKGQPAQLPEKTFAYDEVEIARDPTTSSEEPSTTSSVNIKRKIFPQVLTTHANYDKLRHFGSTTRGSSLGVYRQISSSLTSSLNNVQSSSSEWSMVTASSHYGSLDPINIESARSQDQGHGYGVIRKKSLPEPGPDSPPCHSIHNQIEYAVVCKPHRV